MWVKWTLVFFVLVHLPLIQENKKRQSKKDVVMQRNFKLKAPSCGQKYEQHWTKVKFLCSKETTQQCKDERCTGSIRLSVLLSNDVCIIWTTRGLLWVFIFQIIHYKGILLFWWFVHSVPILNRCIPSAAISIASSMIDTDWLKVSHLD